MRRETGIEKLADEVATLRSDPKIRKLVGSRTSDFTALRERGSDAEWFSELSFCLMTANSTARLGMKIQESLGDGCLSLPPEMIEAVLSKHGHRFSRARAAYICEARAIRDLRATVESYGDDRRAREWLVGEIRGLGYKEASHFLRNTGHFDVAILDRHVLRLMHDFSLIDEVPKSLTRKRYLEIESVLEKLARRIDMPLGVLDMYLWYLKTGEILK